MSLLPLRGTSRVKLTEMNMTPLIDCVFQLLLFFMVGMKFKEVDRQLEARLGRGRPGTEIVPELLVEIQRGGTEAAPAPRILIDRIPMRSLEAARDYLRRYAQFPRATEAHVIVAPADDAIHDWVMKVLDILKQLGYEKFSFRQ